MEPERSSKFPATILLGFLGIAGVVGVYLVSTDSKKITPQVSGAPVIAINKTETNKPEWTYTVKAATYTAFFGVTEQSAKVKLEKEGLTIVTTQPMQKPELTQESDRYIFTDSATQTRHVYHVLDDGLKEDIVLAKVPSVNTFPVRIEASGLQIAFSEDNIPVFTDQVGEYKFHLEAPFMKDSAGNENKNISYRLKKQEEPIFNFDLVVDKDWLTNPQRVYPVTIDPTMSFKGVYFRGGVGLAGPPPATSCNSTVSCGSSFTCKHTVRNGVAPVAKTVTYGTVLSSLTGTSQCWITQNLGADRQATAATDDTEASAGWYWLFNRKKGYKYTTYRTPGTTWTASIDESSDWTSANDPCTLELGADWRLPTYTEWLNADSTGAWANYNDTYASVLKLHTAGSLASSSGNLGSRGSYGYYWSSSQLSSTSGRFLTFRSAASSVSSATKAYGLSIRCLRDEEEEWACGDDLTKNHVASGGVAPVDKNVTYGTVQSSLTGTSQCWITQNLGATDQASSATDSDEASAGWYWQFNRKQGYKHDGATRTPNTAWIDSIDENLNWETANDPCTLELGSGWRLPTYTEWTNADSTGAWENSDDTYASVLKLHTSGYLESTLGELSFRGSIGYYWSGSQDSTTNSYALYTGGVSMVFSPPKPQTNTVRCLKNL